jgi:type IV secretory pathway VirD2 relaxase
VSGDENDFRVRPGTIRHGRAGPKHKSFVAQVLKAARKAGPAVQRTTSSGRSFGAGRSGFGRGRAAFSRTRLFSPARRVVVKARVVRHQGRSFRSAPLSAHLSYLKRDGVSRDGERGVMFDAVSDRADDRAFAERCEDDRHHFRFIVSPEDAGDMTDLKAFTRDLAQQMESDLGTRLDWVAVDHWNTDNPHVHLLVRGVDETGADLVMSRDYISRGLRSRAEDLVAIELGPKPEHAIRSALEREVDADRWTRLDVEIRFAADETGLIDLRPAQPGPDDPEQRRLMVGRLQKLERMGLATSASPGQWMVGLEAEKTVTVWDEDAGLAAEKLRLVEKVIQGRDFTCMPEGVNALEAWLGSIPGHAYANVRQPPVSTLNLAHTIPLSAVWAGPARDEHFQAPPLLFGKTEGSTPFRLSLHVGDVGHMLIVGPTGAGKSVLLSLMAMQFRRYRNNQIFAFDFGGSIRTAALAMGGDWHDLGGSLSAGSEHSVSLQPLARIDEQAERAWAAEWVAAILAKEGVTIDPTAKEHVWSALTSLASSPVGERTITGLAVLLQSTALKQALQPYCVGGPSGRLLDAETEQLGSASVQAFETEGLIGAGAAPAVLTYLFHRIEGRLDGRPTLLIIDEGWLVLDDPAFAQQLREWLKTLRKKNASVVFATQSLSDIDGSSIAPAIVESCPTRIFLPNERAIEPQITAIYRRFGLNDRQIEILARATPKRDYYCQSRRGNRLFELGLGPVALAFCAASSKADHAAIERVVAEHGREAFTPTWLADRDLQWAADLVPDLTNLETSS